MPHIDAALFQKRFVSLILRSGDMPKRQIDRHILLLSAALGLEPQRQYTEREINDQLARWTARYGHSVNLDHVTLRRYLVDEHYVQRDSAGRAYELTPSDWPYTYDPSIAALDLEALAEEGRATREQMKQRYTSPSEG